LFILLKIFAMKKNFTLCLAMLMGAATHLAIAEPTAVRPTNGDGSITNPYEIDSLPNLRWLSDSSDYWDKHFIQTANIDADSTRLWNIVGVDTLGFRPIGNDSIPFTGTYNGKTHIISNLYINRPMADTIGLFGYVQSDSAKIDSLGVVEATIIGKNYVGGVAGYNDSSSTITHCYITGTIFGTDTVGGLTGYNAGIVTDCYSLATVGAADYAGGLAGYNAGSGSITNCYVAGMVDGNDSVGGVVGYNSGSVTNCFYDSITTGQHDDEGKGAPKTTAEMMLRNTFIEWYFVANPIWAIHEGSSYPYFAWQSAPATVNILVANATSDTLNINLYNVVDSVLIYKNGVYFSKCGEISTTSDTAIVLAGGVSVRDTLTFITYEHDKAPSYPVRAVVEPFVGRGTADAPYQIANLADLKYLSDSSWLWNMHFVQTANIDAAATYVWNIVGSDTLGFRPIGNAAIPFTGTYSGSYNEQRYSIGNLYINRPNDTVGLFGYTSASSKIEQLIVLNVNMKGQTAGGIVGYNEGRVQNSFASGNVGGTGTSIYLGGIAGINKKTVEKCHSSVFIIGTANVATDTVMLGGIVGQSLGSSAIVENSSFSGKVVGDSATMSAGILCLGGIVGGGDTVNVTNSYSSGTVNSNAANANIGGIAGWKRIDSIIYSFSLQGPAIGNSKSNLSDYSKYIITSTQMSTRATFVGWDFANTWTINGGDGFPYFTGWQSAPVGVNVFTSDTLNIYVLYPADSVVVCRNGVCITLTDEVKTTGDKDIPTIIRADTLTFITYEQGKAPSYIVRAMAAKGGSGNGGGIGNGNSWITTIYGAHYDATRLRWVMNCDNTDTIVTVAVSTANPAANVYYDGKMQNDKTFVVDLQRADVYTIEYVVRTSDNVLNDTIRFLLERQFSFEEIGDQKRDNVFYVNNNPVHNGGYTFVAYQWYKNDVPLTDDKGRGKWQYYSAPDGKTHNLNDTVSAYRVEMLTDSGKTLSTCPFYVEDNNRSEVLRVYPNPVLAKELSIEDETLQAGDEVEIYSVTGTLVGKYPAQGNITRLAVPTLPRGIYFVKVKDKNIKIVIQ
jgi:hypothetical protein